MAGGRDHALLLCTVQAGPRVSEVLALLRAGTHLATALHVRVLGKGRKQRVAPLTRQTVAVLRVWMRQTDDRPADGPLFPRATADR